MKKNRTETKSRLQLYETYMTVMGPLTSLMFYWQAYKIFDTRQAAAISFFAFAWSLVGLSSWLVYGILIKSKILIWSNIIGICGALLVLIGAILYG